MNTILKEFGAGETAPEKDMAEEIALLRVQVGSLDRQLRLATRLIPSLEAKQKDDQQSINALAGILTRCAALFPGDPAWIDLPKRVEQLVHSAPLKEAA